MFSFSMKPGATLAIAFALMASPTGSRMATDGMWPIRCLEPRDLFHIQPHLHCGNRVFQVRNFRCPHDRGGHRALAKQPGHLENCRGAHDVPAPVA